MGIYIYSSLKSRKNISIWRPYFPTVPSSQRLLFLFWFLLSLFVHHLRLWICSQQSKAQKTINNNNWITQNTLIHARRLWRALALPLCWLFSLATVIGGVRVPDAFAQDASAFFKILFEVLSQSQWINAILPYFLLLLFNWVSNEWYLSGHRPQV